MGEVGPVAGSAQPVPGDGAGVEGGREDAQPAVKPLSLKRNFSWTLAGNLVYAGCQWGMLVVLAQLGSPEVVGLFALGLAICAPVVLFFNMQLRNVQATDAKDEFTFGDYLGLRAAGILLALTTIAGIVWVAGYRGEVALVILLVGLAKAVEALSDVSYGLFQRVERLDEQGRSLLLRGPLALAGLGGIFWATGSLPMAVGAMGLAWLLVLLVHDGAKVRRILAALPGATGVTLARVRKLAWVAWPLAAAALVVSLQSNIPRYFIEHHLGAAELGIFAALAWVIVAGNTVVTALGQAAVSRMSQRFAAGDRRGYLRMLGGLLAMGAGLGVAAVVGAALVGRPFLGLVYGAEYAERLDVFLLLMVVGGIGFMQSFSGYALHATRRFLVQLPLGAGTLFVTVVFCAALLPDAGLMGAALALAGALTFKLFGTLWMCITAATPGAQRQPG